MALVQHPACKLSAVRFLDDDRQSDLCHFVSGSWEQKVNYLHLWSADEQTGARLVHQQELDSGDVSAIQPLNGNLLATASSSGSVALYVAEGQELKQVCERRVSCDVLTSLAFASGTGPAVVIAGEDGALSLLHLDQLSGPITRRQVSPTPITSLDCLSGSDVLCGDTAGCIKAIDRRTVGLSVTLCNSLSPITAVRRNPSNPHLIVSTVLVCACRSDLVPEQASGSLNGNLCLWDLRKADAALLQLAAHSACVTELQYKENEANVVLSSSLDGKLIRWTLLPTCEVSGAEAIVSPQSLAGPAILCFHMHKRSSALVLATDKEILSVIHV